MKYFLNTPSLNNLEKKYILDVLKTTWLSSNGKHTREFEKKFVKFLGLKYGIAVQSGTSALHVALKAAGVKTGDRVITPNYTCVSNLSCITQCNATPVIVEVERDTLGLDVDLVKKAIKIYILFQFHVFMQYAEKKKLPTSLLIFLIFLKQDPVR